MAVESTFRFACPSCGKRLYAPMSRAGKRGKCSACGNKVKIPPPQFTHVELVELEAAGKQAPLPPADGPDGAIPVLPPLALRVIHFGNRSAAKAVAEAMSAHETFALVTDDRRFNPLGRDVYSAEVWIETAGGGLLMLLGSGLLIAAFTSNQPISKLGLYVSGGSILALTGGLILQTVLLLRSSYVGNVTVDAATGKCRWILKPTA